HHTPHVDNFPFVVSKAASVPAGSRNSLASTSAGRSIPAASRNRPASIHAGRHISASTMFLNVDQLENQLDKEEFQEIVSMVTFKVLKTQFQKFIKSQTYLDDEYVIMTRKNDDEYEYTMFSEEEQEEKEEEDDNDFISNRYYDQSMTKDDFVGRWSLGLKSHVEDDTMSTNPDWFQLDDLIKMWILYSLCDSLQEQVVTTPGNVKALWDHLKDLFHDNKDNRAINLDNELRSIKIGTMTVNEYCTKIRSMAEHLKNLGCDVSDKTLVMYTVNGLDSRFATLVNIIRHRETLPSFETTRNMLLLKEPSFKDDTRTSSTFDGSSSSPTALVTSTSSTPKGSLGLKSHVEDDTASTNPDWCQLDDLIKMYSRAINLDNELRSIKIGTMTVNEYCTKIRSMVDRLKNLGCDVSDKNLVMYTINGLDSRFATLVDIIRHRETLPSFETTRTMLLLKESSFKDDTRTSSSFDWSSSSPTALVTSTSSIPKGSSSKSHTLPQLCNHFNKGTCRFGDRCKYIHDHQNRVGLSSTRNQSRSTASSHAGVWNMARIQHRASAPHVSSYKPSYNSTAGQTAFYTGLVHYSSQPHPL
nr:hybrid signal transduction histidine kinase M [Tanacetum cinerariifolium]